MPPIFNIPTPKVYPLDSASLEATHKGAFITSCHAIKNVYDALNTSAEWVTKGPESLAGTINGAIKSLEEQITFYIKKLDKLLQDLYNLLSVDLVEVDNTYFNWYSQQPYIRRALGEFYYWSGWETYKLIDDNVSGISNDVKRILLDQAILAIQAVIKMIGNIGYQTWIDWTIKWVIEVLYQKTITPTIIPNYLYPQVTTRSTFRKSGDKAKDVNGNDVTVGPMVGLEYVIPTLPIPDPFDPGFEEYVLTKNLAVLTKPLLNENTYRPSEAYWTSNWRSYNTIGVNYLFYPPIKSGNFGPTWNDPLHHLTSFTAAFPILDDNGVATNMEPYIGEDGKLNPILKTLKDTNIPTKSVPNAYHWAIIDVLYEMHEIALSVDGVCIESAEMIGSWTKILNILGVGQYITDHTIDSQYAYNHSPTYKINSDPVVFGSELVKLLFEPVRVLQAELEAKVAEIEAVLQNLPSTAAAGKAQEQADKAAAKSAFEASLG